MTSLTRFKQKLRGELPKKDDAKPVTDLQTWVELVTEKEADEPSDDETEVVTENDDAAEIEDWEAMTKAGLDLYAAEKHGIQLDRRQSKPNMITEFIQKLKEKN